MTRPGRGLTAILVALVSSGCLVSSLHPVYEAESIVFDDILLGQWENAESEIRVAIGRGEWRSYVVAFTDRFGTTKYNAHLTTIGAARYLNVIPQGGLEQPPFVAVTNGFLQIEVDKARVRVREPDYTTVLERARSGKLGLDSATDLKQNVIITAASARLRTWLAASIKDDALWADWKTFTRSVQ